jgi:hypothetical protein
MNVLAFLIKILPTVLEAVIAVEGIITTPKSGATKKQLVLDSLDAVAKAGEAADNKTVAGISALVDNVVTSLNKGGIFTSTKTA